MAAPILTDTHIEEMSQTIREKRLGIHKVEFQYKKGQVYIDALGVEGIPQTETYYENIEDHLVFTELSWLSPICNQFKVNINASIEVNPEGEFDHDLIPLELLTSFPKDLEIHQILYRLRPVLERLIPFRSYMTNVELSWHDSCLASIRFYMKIEGKKVNTIINSSQGTNHQILRQWASTITAAIDYNKGRYKHRVDLPIVNGRMNTASYETGLCFRFSPRGKRP